MGYIIEDWLLVKILGWSGNDLDEFPLEEMHYNFCSATVLLSMWRKGIILK